MKYLFDIMVIFIFKIVFLLEKLSKNIILIYIFYWKTAWSLYKEIN
jgi:hypothetical protein